MIPARASFSSPPCSTVQTHPSFHALTARDVHTVQPMSLGQFLAQPQQDRERAYLVQAECRYYNQWSHKQFCPPLSLETISTPSPEQVRIAADYLAEFKACHTHP